MHPKALDTGNIRKSGVESWKNMHEKHNLVKDIAVQTLFENESDTPKVSGPHLCFQQQQPDLINSGTGSLYLPGCSETLGIGVSGLIIESSGSCKTHGNGVGDRVCNASREEKSLVCDSWHEVTLQALQALGKLRPFPASEQDLAPMSHSLNS